jgi:thiamine biosynthesis lipoprotein
MTDNGVLRQSWVEQIMGMPVSVHLRGDGLRDAARVSEVVAQTFGQLREVDRLFSTYRPESEVSALKRGELQPSACHPLVKEVLELCDLANERTDGFFNAWLLPAGFDPSGLVKGWAVERAAKLLAGIESCDCYLNAGGDMMLGAASTESPDWKVGIEDPRDSSRIIAVQSIRSGGIATSGNAARGLHIVNPHTGQRADELLSVTVMGSSLLWADVFATAAFAHGSEALPWLASRLPGYQALIVDKAGQLTSFR